MKVSLNPDTERMISERISTGRYRSADEVVRKGLELLQASEVGTRKSAAQISTDLSAVFSRIAAEIPDNEWERVPGDLSKNLDHYLYDVTK